MCGRPPLHLSVFVITAFASSMQVKLRRRTKGEVWEVVNLQGTDETLSVLTSLKQVEK